MKRLNFLLLSFFISNLVFSQATEFQDNVLKNYQEYCANCHGDKFQGVNAQSLVDGIWQFGGKNSYMFRNIKFGIQHLGMPSFEASLSDKEINNLVSFLHEEEKKAGVSRPPIPEFLETQDYKMRVEVFAASLDSPWASDFMDTNIALITEKPGNLRIVRNGNLIDAALEGIPEVLYEGQGGLMDVAVDPNYQDNGWIYLAYSHALAQEGSSDKRQAAMTRIVRGQIMGNRWVNQQTVFEAPQETYRTTRHHYGSRIVFDPDGFLYFSIGDRGGKDHAQDLSKPNGKVHRVLPNGDIPKDNLLHFRRHHRYSKDDNKFPQNLHPLSIHDHHYASLHLIRSYKNSENQQLRE